MSDHAAKRIVAGAQTEVDPMVVIECMRNGISANAASRRFGLSSYRVNQIVAHNSEDPVAVWVASGCSQARAEARADEFATEQAKSDYLEKRAEERERRVARGKKLNEARELARTKKAKAREDLPQQALDHIAANPDLKTTPDVARSMRVKVSTLEATGATAAFAEVLLNRRRKVPLPDEEVARRASLPRKKRAYNTSTTEVLEALTAGTSVEETAERFGLTTSRVYQIIREDADDPAAVRWAAAASSRRDATALLSDYLGTTQEATPSGFEAYLKTLAEPSSYAWAKRHLGPWRKAVAALREAPDHDDPKTDEGAR